MKYTHILLTLLACALLGVGPTADSASPPPHPASGIKGVAQSSVHFGPSRVGEPPPVLRPLPNAILTFQPAGGGAEIARVTANAQGQFQENLPAGTYLVVPLLPADDQPKPGAPESMSLKAEPQTVTVAPKRFVSITVLYTMSQP